MKQPKKDQPANKTPDIAFGLRKNAIGWMTVEYHIVDGKVVQEKVSEPDFRSIILEKFQKLVTYFWHQ